VFFCISEFFVVADKKSDNRTNKLNTTTVLLKIQTYQVWLDLTIKP